MIVVTDILKDFFDNLDFTLSVTSYSDDGTNTFIQVENTLHARAGINLNVNNTDYTIISVVNNTIEIPGVIIPNVVILQAPFYFDGTPRMVNNELTLIQDRTEKTPLLYVAETIRENWPNDPEGNVLVEANIRVFFLDNANFKDWLSSDYYDNVIRRLRNLAELYINSIEASPMFGPLLDFDLINLPNFGQYQDFKGSVQSIFNEKLSGVEFAVRLSILKNLYCGNDLLNLPN